MPNKDNATQVGSTNALYAFYLKALVLFGIFMAFYYSWFLDSAWYGNMLAFLLDNTTRLLNAINFEHTIHFDRIAGYAEIKTDVGGGIVNGGLVLVHRHSDAFIPISLMLAVILAWPGNITRKLIFALIGTLLMVALNLMRMASLIIIDHYWPLYFPAVNQWIFPTLIVVFALSYFYLWTRVYDKSQKSG